MYIQNRKVAISPYKERWTRASECEQHEGRKTPHYRKWVLTRIQRRLARVSCGLGPQRPTKLSVQTGSDDKVNSYINLEAREIVIRYPFHVCCNLRELLLAFFIVSVHSPRDLGFLQVFSAMALHRHLFLEFFQSQFQFLLLILE